MQIRYLRSLASALLALPLFAVPVMSADGGGGGGGGGGMGGGSGGGGGADPLKCRTGLVYNKKTKKCEPPKAGMIDDDSLYRAGRALAMDGRYDDAIKVLALAADKTDARILNYLGYSHRKAGRILVGLGYYQEAILNDPGCMPVREYMGEAHLTLGDIAGARLQLSEIERRCGTGCREYGLLREQIDSYLKG
ncbi:tetratricopeptide (TPR) repeat protein [Aminobacter lissarensis]|uniref:Tetratricopeptide (TPR) repeat protein n=1 Tax=Aminobacter carboxidus TaxID=376165 RepID=A0A8E2BAY8_9HYPH|nr:tetratricopeptide repeat protein [Aminobacter lissarensis]MBB6464302.1 tetratricopeptide (TPR) repeat protein [Aminobacter lissarensis]